MCRLMVLSSTEKLTVSHHIVMSYMLALSERSGNTHGTGVGTNTSFLKFGDNASEVVIKDEYVEWVKGLIDEEEHSTIVGHTRLASLGFRGVANTEYLAGDAHPFRFGDSEESWGALYHNGTFKEHEEIAKNLGLEDDLTLIDTALFTKFLERELEGSVPTADVLVEVLKQVGKADYAMLLTHNTTPDIMVVRGTKPLFKANTNYGLMINTDQSNITDLPGVVNPGLKLLGGRLLTVETPARVPEWTINSVTAGVFSKIRDIDEVKAISDPPYKHTPATSRKYDRHQWDGHGGYPASRGGVNPNYAQRGFEDDLAKLKSEIHGDAEISATKIARQAMAINSITTLSLDGGISDTEIDRMFYDVHGKGAPWFTQEPERLEEMALLVEWIWEKYPKTTVTDQKVSDWVNWKKACIKAGADSSESIYHQASKLLQAEFVMPWFLNDQEDLNTMVALISEIKYETTDNRTT